jgi:hypothetical protein
MASFARGIPSWERQKDQWPSSQGGLFCHTKWLLPVFINTSPLSFSKTKKIPFEKMPRFHSLFPNPEMVLPFS